jgi:hypothetical protein
MASATLDAPVSEIPAQQRMAVLERAAASLPFRRSQRLRDFLLYVGREAVHQSRLELHEQEIGEAVFGRAPDYDTTADNIVRVTATELRKRLETYFSTEGAREVLIAEIPRGSYLPVFHRRVTQPPPLEPKQLAEHTLPAEAVASKEKAFRRAAAARLLWPWQLAVVILLAALAWLAYDVSGLTRALTPWKAGPALRVLWTPFFQTGTATDLVLADTSFALVEDITGREVPLGDYLDSAYPKIAENASLSAAQKTDLALIMERNNGSFGDFQVAHQILDLDPGSTQLRVHFARDYTPDSLDRSNVILIGSRKSNPWVDLFQGQMNFVLRYNPTTRQSYVENRHPGPGEQAVYDASASSDSGDGYSVIALLPGVTAGKRVLILEGTGSEATNSAGDFVSKEASLKSMQAKMGRVLPQAFEVLLRTTHLRGTPLRSSIVAVRVHSE